MDGGYEIAVLDYGEFDNAETFTEYKLPPLPEREGYTAVGYVLLKESGFDYFDNLYFDGGQPRAIGSVALGDTLTAQDLGIVPQNEDGVRQAEIHTVWTQNNGNFAIEFYDDDTLFNKVDVGFLIDSSGLVYLAAFPTPSHDGLIFNGWYDSTGNRIDAVTWFDFYPLLENAQSMEDREWKKKMPCRLYASYMDPYGNEQTPEIPLPDCSVVFYQTHSVSNAVVTLNDRWHTTGVHVRIWDEQVRDSVLEHDLTPGDPLSVFEFALIHADGIVPVRLTVKARQDIPGQAPGLGGPVTDVFHPDARLLHHFPPDRALQGLPDLGEARHQGVVPEALPV